ncbi:VWA domain-containing protein [Spirillospora sp. NPDC048911]|uniref:vWA domain-containing protein n=1 Tax=Spirillospora sp. NPDC048911 TaxID=3364527 RepID=UPI00371E47F4
MTDPYQMTQDRQPYVMKPKCLPTYLVVDVSSSMFPHQDMLNRTLDKLHASLTQSPRVSEFAHMSIIAFSTQPQVVIEMTDMEYVPAMPEVMCNGLTNYGAAFDLVRQRIDLDVADLNAQGKAVLRPAVFFLTDGAPSDPGWEQSFQRLIDRTWNRHPHVITYGFGAAPEMVLGKVATKAAFVADGSSDQDAALAAAINSLLNSLVASSQAGEMQIPIRAEGYRTVPLEYMD